MLQAPRKPSGSPHGLESTFLIPTVTTSPSAVATAAEVLPGYSSAPVRQLLRADSATAGVGRIRTSYIQWPSPPPCPRRAYKRLRASPSRQHSAGVYAADAVQEYSAEGMGVMQLLLAKWHRAIQRDGAHFRSFSVYGQVTFSEARNATAFLGDGPNNTVTCCAWELLSQFFGVLLPEAVAPEAVDVLVHLVRPLFANVAHMRAHLEREEHNARLLNESWQRRRRRHRRRKARSPRVINNKRLLTHDVDGYAYFEDDDIFRQAADDNGGGGDGGDGGACQDVHGGSTRFGEHNNNTAAAREANDAAGLTATSTFDAGAVTYQERHTRLMVKIHELRAASRKLDGQRLRAKKENARRQLVFNGTISTWQKSLMSLALLSWRKWAANNKFALQRLGRVLFPGANLGGRGGPGPGGGGNGGAFGNITQAMRDGLSTRERRFMWRLVFSMWRSTSTLAILRRTGPQLSEWEHKASVMAERVTRQERAQKKVSTLVDVIVGHVLGFFLCSYSRFLSCCAVGQVVARVSARSGKVPRRDQGQTPPDRFAQWQAGAVADQVCSSPRHNGFGVYICTTMLARARSHPGGPGREHAVPRGGRGQGVHQRRWLGATRARSRRWAGGGDSTRSGATEMG